MQADMPVGSGGSTCSPFHNVHSFPIVARALQRHIETQIKDCGDALQETWFSVYLNLALNNRSREGWGGWRGQEAREGGRTGSKWMAERMKTSLPKQGFF